MNNDDEEDYGDHDEGDDDDDDEIWRCVSRDDSDGVSIVTSAGQQHVSAFRVAQG